MSDWAHPVVAAMAAYGIFLSLCGVADDRSALTRWGGVVIVCALAVGCALDLR